MELVDRYRGCLLGLAAGDAAGTTVEFKPRGSFPPVTGMTGGGPFRLKPGQWTDDPSMALCLAASLIERQGFDARDQMERYVRWYREGYFSSTGACFDVGNTTREALETFRQTGEPFSGPTRPNAAGNGSIMRLAPVPLYYYPDHEAILHYSAENSRTTHGALECIEACRLLGGIIAQALKGGTKEQVLLESQAGSFQAPSIEAIARGDYFSKPENEILGSGYVVKSLEAALWCFWITGTFEEAVLKAEKLGGDADTPPSVCGQLAGAFYREHGDPARWLEKLALREEIRALADGLLKN